jgi:hypothetical protein
MTRKPAAVLLVLSLAVLAIVVLPAAGLAAKGGGAAQGGGGKPGGGSSSFSLVVMDGASQATHNGRVTFAVSTTQTDRPYVGLRCWQGSAWVYDGYVGYFAGYMFEEDWFTLDSPYWVDGASASCSARLFYFDRRGNEKVLATMDFPVAS